MQNAHVNDFHAEIRRQIERAERRCDAARSDWEYEANRQLVIWLKSKVEAIGRKAA